MQMMKEEMLSQMRYRTGKYVSLVKSQGIDINAGNEPAIDYIPVSGEAKEKESKWLFGDLQFN